MAYRFSPIATLLMILAGLAAAGTDAHAKPKVAVLGLESIDQGKANPQLAAAAATMTQLLRREASKPKSPYELSRAGNADLINIKLMYDCPDEARSCMSEVTKNVLKAGRVIYGNVAEEPGKGYLFQLKLLNASTQQPEGTVTEVVPYVEARRPEEAARWARSFYNRLIGINEDGKLVVRANVDRATVYVDDEIAGNLSDGSATVPNVKPGERSVRVETDGASAESSVEVRAGETAEVDLELVGLGGGPIGGGRDDGEGSKLGWQIAFTAGVLGVVGGVSYSMYQNSRAGVFPFSRDGAELVEEVAEVAPPENMDLVRNGNPLAPGDDPCVADNRGDVPSLDERCKKGEDAVLYSNIAGFSALAVGLATIYFGYKAFLDNGSSGERDDLSSRRERKRPVVRVIPAGPGDVGASLEVTF